VFICNINNKFNIIILMEIHIIGPVKIKDGLFMGDEYAAHVSFISHYFKLRILNLSFRIKSLI